MLVYPNHAPHAHLQTVQASPWQGHCLIFGYWHPVDWNNNVYGVDNYGNTINQIVGEVYLLHGHRYHFIWYGQNQEFDVDCN